MRSRIAGLAALGLVVAGIVLSHRVEPGVRVERVTIAGDVPALRFVPEGDGPHPVALLAHGVTASKETLFRFGEALAAAGFTAVAIDFPGHGQSHRPFRPDAIRAAIPRVAAELGGLDVFLGHSMGAYVGSASLADPGFRPATFIAVGAVPPPVANAPPLLILCGRFEEAVPQPLGGLATRLASRPATRLVVSPWSDHALEPYDPVLVGAAVEESCRVAGEPAPPPPMRWIVRLAGAVMATLGAVGLALLVPALPARVAWMRGPLVAGIVLAAIVLTTSPWAGVLPVAKRLPVRVAAMLVAWLGLHLAGRLKIPRWSYAAAFALLALMAAVAGAYFPSLFAALAAMLLGAGALVGALAARGGSRRDGDLAMAMFAAYAFGQWFPLLY